MRVVFEASSVFQCWLSGEANENDGKANDSFGYQLHQHDHQYEPLQYNNTNINKKKLFLCDMKVHTCKYTQMEH